jgi:hypothetical protein
VAVFVASKPNPLEEPLAAQECILVKRRQADVIVPPVLRDQLPFMNYYGIGRAKFVAVVVPGIFESSSGQPTGA